MRGIVAFRKSHGGQVLRRAGRYSLPILALEFSEPGFSL